MNRLGKSSFSIFVVYYAEKNSRMDLSIGSLRSWHLVDRENNFENFSLRIHRSLQRTIRIKLDQNPSQRQACFMQALALLRTILPRQSAIHAPNEGQWGIYEKYLPHVLSLHKVFEDSKSMAPGIDESSELAEIFSDAGRYMWEKRMVTSALSILQSSERICTNLPSENLLVLRAKTLATISALHCFIGFSGRKLGEHYAKQNLELLQEYHERCQGNSIQIPESELMLLANAWEDYASTCMDCERFSEVEDSIQRSLDIKRRLGDETTHPSAYAISLLDLGGLRLVEGRRQEWIDLMNQGLDLLSTDSENNLRMIQATKYEMAAQWLACGNSEKALQLASNLIEELALSEEESKADLTALNSLYLIGISHHAMESFYEAE
jgi:tetratricopeptide (TPR) repeat protein